MLDAILAKVPGSTPAKADLLVEFNFEELHDAVEKDLILASELKLKDVDTALERALMYLHEQHVVTLQKGLAVFRSAMTIRMPPEAKGEKYKASHYQPLEHHYRERVLQVHVMSEYARKRSRNGDFAGVVADRPVRELTSSSGPSSWRVSKQSPMPVTL